MLMVKVFVRITTENAKGKEVTGLYCLEKMDPDPLIARRAWRLTRLGGESYDIHDGEFGPACSCPDYLWRQREGKGERCKHIAAVLSAGLLGR